MLLIAVSLTDASRIYDGNIFTMQATGNHDWSYVLQFDQVSNYQCLLGPVL